MFTYLIQGLTLGFAAAVQPGPFQAFLLGQVFSVGWRRTLPAAMAPLISDGPIIIVILYVLNKVPEWFQRGLALAGGMFILYLAYGSYQQWQGFRQENRAVDDEKAQGSYTSLWRAILMNMLGPGPYLYWSLIAGPILLRGWHETPSHGLFFLTGFYAAMVAVLVAIIVLLGTAERSGSRVRRAFLGISVVALAGFGIYELWIGLSGL